MVSRTTRRGLIMLTLLCMLSFWAIRQQQTGQDGPTEGLDIKLNYALNNLEMRAFDQNGDLAVLMTAPRMANDADTNVGTIEQPRVEVQHEGFQWNIMARSATVSNNHEIIYLNGDVSLRRQGADNNDWLTGETSDLTFEVTPRVAYSDSPIELREPAGSMNAKGFTIDITQNTFELPEQVSATFDLQ